MAKISVIICFGVEPKQTVTLATLEFQGPGPHYVGRKNIPHTWQEAAEMVSRQHLALVFNRGWKVLDISTNGAWIMGVKMTPGATGAQPVGNDGLTITVSGGFSFFVAPV